MRAARSCGSRVPCARVTSAGTRRRGAGWRAFLPVDEDDVLIVNYHAIEPVRSAVSCTPEDFRADIHALRDAGFTFVSLDDCADWLAGRCDLPACAAAITFDDGYASVASRAVPFLVSQAVPATVFVIAG